MKILKGQTFDDAEVAGQRDVAILSQSLARFLFGEEDPIGRRVSMSARDPMHRVVGIVSDARQTSPRDRGVGVMYLPIESVGRAILAVRVADSVSPDVVRQPVDAIVGRHLAGRVRTIAEALDLAIARERLLSGVALFLAALVVLIGCVGLYALMTYDVERRRRELGIRLALGATARQVQAMVLRDGATLVVPALAIGVPAGIVMSRMLSSQLYGVETADPSTLFCVGAAVVRCWTGGNAQARRARVAHRSAHLASRRIAGRPTIDHLTTAGRRPRDEERQDPLCSLMATSPRRHLSMLRSYTPADALTIGNASCGTIAIFLCLDYLASGDRRLLWTAFLLLPVA